MAAALARVYMWTSHRIEREKSDVQLLCRADGDPTPTVTWLDRNDVTIKNNSQQHQVRYVLLTSQAIRPTNGSGTDHYFAKYCTGPKN